MSRALTILTMTLTACLSSAAAQKGPDDPKRAKKISAKESEVAAAREQLSLANRKVQKVYADFKKMYDAIVAGTDSDADRDLKRALGDACRAARKGLTTATNNERVRKRVRKKFLRDLAAGLKRLEHRFLVRIPGRIKAASVAVFDDDGTTPDRLTPETFVSLVHARLFGGDVPFWRLWNDDLVDAMKEVEPYRERRKNVEKLEQELMVLKDPKMAYTIGAPPGMARIPGGSYVVEARFGFKKKRKTVRLNAFFIDRFEVTHEDYWKKFYRFITDKVKIETRLPRDRDKKPIWILDPETDTWRPPEELLKLPVTGIDCDSALAYALSQNKRLPTEAEWVAAASGSANGRAMYPFGDTYVAGRCNDREAKIGHTVAVDSYPDGRSLFGIYNMAGNVKEWLATSDKGDKDFIDKLPESGNIVIRGGSYLSDRNGVSTRWRWVLPAYFSFEPDVGFRCARSIR